MMPASLWYQNQRQYKKIIGEYPWWAYSYAAPLVGAYHCSNSEAKFSKVKQTNWYLALITMFPTLSQWSEQQNSFLLENGAYIKSSRSGLHTCLVQELCLSDKPQYGWLGLDQATSGGRGRHSRSNMEMALKGLPNETSTPAPHSLDPSWSHPFTGHLFFRISLPSPLPCHWRFGLMPTVPHQYLCGSRNLI